MPEYIYEHPETGEQVIVLQSIHEEHVYEIDGVSYNRVYTIPNASIDTQIDPHSQQEFREKAKGTIGDLWDQSAEASAKRAARYGEDPVKKKFFEDYSKERKGAKHPQDPSRIKPSKHFTIE
tara:strand:- start:716 stop:1081 length:366 start_codon:yes stop_codon:yes gene_type:complete